MSNASYYMLMFAACAIGSTGIALLGTMWGIFDPDAARTYVLSIGPIGIASFIGSRLANRLNI